MSNFDEFVTAIKEGAQELAGDIFGGYKEAAVEDAQTFLNKSKDDLESWTKMLSSGELTKEDFKDLVDAKKALAEIHLLTQQGLALIKLERFRTELMNLVIGKAFSIFL